MILAYLVLAHLLGDFVFQPSKLVQWKMESKMGTLVHASIHLLVGFLILSPFIFKGYYSLILVLLFVNVIHFFIDEGKINYDLKHDEKVKPFLLDQLVHFVVILIGFLFVSDIRFILPNTFFHRLFTDIRMINFVSFVVFVTSVVEIYNFQIAREKNKKTKIVFKRKDMEKRAIIFTIIYFAFMLISIFAFGKGNF
ncbi:hypothetical protein COU74_02605 [Candidatus Peregrinibacteria bacterium CG10_big_fil_rev_8_21_14_0_10_36_19]|nr:MAG: hypothetical protein COU74_02605 [Candidatus Peregrinibacteria bacterium CG10_big_fil_rev_8_21_14_0_10_36_19]